MKKPKPTIWLAIERNHSEMPYRRAGSDVADVFYWGDPDVTQRMV